MNKKTNILAKLPKFFDFLLVIYSKNKNLSQICCDADVTYAHAYKLKLEMQDKKLLKTKNKAGRERIICLTTKGKTFTEYIMKLKSLLNEV